MTEEMKLIETPYQSSKAMEIAAELTQQDPQRRR